MARLLDWPNGLRTTMITPLTGPTSLTGNGGQSLDGFDQSVTSPYFSWEFKIDLEPVKGAKARAVREWFTALHNGANATTFKVIDPDRAKPYEVGYDGVEWNAQIPWANGEPWSNSNFWIGAYPLAGINVAAAKGATIIELKDEFWGHNLSGGDWIGFTPLHLGLYTITEDLFDGKYRIYPPLRKAITVDDSCTMQPSLALRLKPQSTSFSRSPDFAHGVSMTAIEVHDEHVRSDFND